MGGLVNTSGQSHLEISQHILYLNSNVLSCGWGVAKVKTSQEAHFRVWEKDR